MKPFLLLVGLFLIPFLASAQQLNEHGLKMVSEIESLRGGLSRKFTFQYDDNSRLEEMNVYYIDEHLNNWELRVGFKIVNGNLQRCEYSDESNVHTEYGMNQRGQVAKFAWWYPMPTVLLLTEWVNFRNPYFIFQEYRDWEYIYDDSGNLTEIREYLLLGEPKLENTVKIKYYYGD